VDFHRPKLFLGDFSAIVGDARRGFEGASRAYGLRGRSFRPDPDVYYLVRMQGDPLAMADTIRMKLQE
jgi:hypothetical protein